MNKNTVIEIEAFADYDISYTVCVMVHSEKIDKDILLNEFYNIEGIKSNEGLDYNKLYAITGNFIAFLELKGFTKLETEKICFTD